MNTNPNISSNPPTPRIYVACLAAYNAGKLHGVWLDALQDADDLAEAVQEMLRQSPEAYAEEYAIHDHEHFGSYAVHEYASLDEVALVAELIETHGEIITEFMAHLGCDAEYARDHFDDAYRGSWPSIEAYAEQLLEDLGALDNLPSWFHAYFDMERYARDLELGGEIWTLVHQGEVHVFANPI
jgi:antirestriction protein